MGLADREPVERPSEDKRAKRRVSGVGVCRKGMGGRNLRFVPKGRKRAKGCAKTRPREGAKIGDENEEILRRWMSSDESERGDVRFAGGWVAAGVFSRCGWVMLSHPARAGNKAGRRREGGPAGAPTVWFRAAQDKVRAKQG